MTALTYLWYAHPRVLQVFFIPPAASHMKESVKDYLANDELSRHQRGQEPRPENNSRGILSSEEVEQSPLM